MIIKIVILLVKLSLSLSMLKGELNHGHKCKTVR